MSHGKTALKVGFLPFVSIMVLVSICVYILILRSMNHTSHGSVSVARHNFAKLCCMIRIGVPVASPKSALFHGSWSLAKLLEHFLEWKPIARGGFCTLLLKETSKGGRSLSERRLEEIKKKTFKGALYCSVRSCVGEAFLNYFLMQSDLLTEFEK